MAANGGNPHVGQSSALVRLDGDNVAVARGLQRTIETLLFPAFADPAGAY